MLYQRVGASGATDVATQNLFADLPGRSERTVVVGAHLDGVANGPGINDNGSGVEVATRGAEDSHRLLRGIGWFWLRWRVSVGAC